jgi:transposase
MSKVFVGHDWAETHHDLFVENEVGDRLGYKRVPEGLEGVRLAHELIGAHAQDPGDVTLASETDHGLFITAMVQAGYRVLAVNPMSTSRYRERLSTSGAKSDPGDARILAELARVDGHLHRPIAGSSDVAEATKVLARAHQSMIWTRQRQVNQLRSTLREFYPGALDAFKPVVSAEALAILTIAPTPARGRALSLSKISAALRRAGRQRGIQTTAARVQTALRVEQLEVPPLVADALGASVSALVAVITEMNTQIDRLETELETRFNSHPDAKIIRSLPGLGTILSARVLGEFGDDPNRFDTAKSRRNYAGTSPITRQSGKHRVVLARYARNRRLADACYLWAFTSLRSSDGAREFYSQRRAAGATHNKALRALANRLVGILHGCLTHHSTYDENTAWGHRQQLAA